MMKVAADYQKQINWSEVSENVGQAARLAIWLIVDHDNTLKHAVDVGTKKNGAKVSPTKKLVKSILPASYLRKKAAARMKPEIKQIIRTKKIAEYEAKKFQKNEEPEIVIVEKPKKLQLEIPAQEFRKFKAYAALKGETMGDLFLKMFNKTLKEDKTNA